MKKALISIILLTTTIIPSQQAQPKIPYAQIFACTALASFAGAIHCHIKEQQLQREIKDINRKIGLEISIHRYKLLKYILGGAAAASILAAIYSFMKGQSTEKKNKPNDFAKRMKSEIRNFRFMTLHIDQAQQLHSEYAIEGNSDDAMKALRKGTQLKLEKISQSKKKFMGYVSNIDTKAITEQCKSRIAWCIKTYSSLENKCKTLISAIQT
jgi:hypothetical protein